MIRISRRCPVPCLHLHYVSPFTGHVFVSKMDVVLLLTRTTDFDGKVLKQICSYFPCPALLPDSVAAKGAAEIAKKAGQIWRANKKSMVEPNQRFDPPAKQQEQQQKIQQRQQLMRDGRDSGRLQERSF